jgi:hypothetical protein
MCTTCKGVTAGTSAPNLYSADNCSLYSPPLLNSISKMKPTGCTFHSILLRIKGLYMFRALLAHLQEMSRLQWNCSFTAIVAQSTGIIHTQYTKRRLRRTSWGWASNARNMKRPLIINKIEWKVCFITLIYYGALSEKKTFNSIEMCSTNVKNEHTNWHTSICFSQYCIPLCTS